MWSEEEYKRMRATAERLGRAIVSAVGALETNVITGDRTALAVLLVVLEEAELHSGFKARRAAQPPHEPDASTRS